MLFLKFRLKSSLDHEVTAKERHSTACGLALANKSASPMKERAGYGENLETFEFWVSNQVGILSLQESPLFFPCLKNARPINTDYASQ